MIGLGEHCPDFSLPALVGLDPTRTVRLADYAGRWLLLYFYPLDFTFVCPLELKAFSDAVPEFEKRDCAVLGGSTDSVYSHLGWIQAKSELRGLRHPLFSDYTKAFTTAMGVLDVEEGTARRAAFLIDPHGIVRFVIATAMGVRRDPAEVLRVLDALQADALCPCNWKIDPATASSAT